MCCIWPPPEEIKHTTILARSDGRHQFIAYQMAVEAKEDVAMTLPVPVALPAREDSLTFVDLSENGEILDQLKASFPDPIHYNPHPTYSLGAETDGLDDDLDADTDPSLEVFEVGSYIASFVPSRADFSRIDARFQLPSSFWDEVKTYEDWGFAVFQLKPGTGGAPIEPMGFVFETRFSDRVFFPTLHLHSEHVEEKANFDHLLMTQGVQLGPRGLSYPEARAALEEAISAERGFEWYPPINAEGWSDATQPLYEVFDLEHMPTPVVDVLDETLAMFKKTIGGMRSNADTWVDLVEPGAPMRGPAERR